MRGALPMIDRLTFYTRQFESFSPKCVDFWEGGKPEYPEKDPRSTGEINNYQQLNSHESPTHERHTPDLAWFFRWWEAQRAIRLATRASPIIHMPHMVNYNKNNEMTDLWNWPSKIYNLMSVFSKQKNSIHLYL